MASAKKFAFVGGSAAAGPPLYCRLDGTSSRAHREAALTELECNPRCKVMLLSIKAGGVGLNLQQGASVCILCEPWWNPAVESQAWGRVHRMGQPRQVYVRRLRCKDTVEGKIFSIQERKAGLASSAFGARSALEESEGAKNALSVEELMSFFRGAEDAEA